MLKKVSKVIEGYEVICPRCTYKWLFTGKRTWQISCPKCDYTIVNKE